MKVIYLLFLLSLTNCAADNSLTVEAAEVPVRVLLLADTTAFSDNWRADFVKQLPGAHRLIVSHTGGETPAEVQKRIPWLLQPGVDELYLNPSAWSEKWLDSLQQLLPPDVKLNEIIF
ncbi:MAG: hypothetical protein AAF433_10885 [Bacteroidota bacterium]